MHSKARTFGTHTATDVRCGRALADTTCYNVLKHVLTITVSKLMLRKYYFMCCFDFIDPMIGLSMFITFLKLILKKKEKKHDYN